MKKKLIRITNNILGLYKGSNAITPHGLGIIYETNYHMNMVSVEFADRNRYYQSYEVKLVLRKYEDLKLEEITQISLLYAKADNELFQKNIIRLKENFNCEHKLLYPLEMILLSRKNIDILGLIEMGFAISYESDIFKKLSTLQK